MFSKYFGNIVQNLGIDSLTSSSSDNKILTVRKTLQKYQNHSTINHNHKKQRDSLEIRAVLLIFSLELELSGTAV